jgi:predicted nucleotidyltransferase
MLLLLSQRYLRAILKWKILIKIERENMNTIEGVKEVLERHKDELEESFKVKEFGVFGSYMRGQQKEKSDRGILVEFEEVPGLFKFVELEDHLAEILGLKVDLVMKREFKDFGSRYC